MKKILTTILLFSFLLIGSISLYPIIFPFYLPEPAGAFVVGKKTALWIDQNRKDPHDKTQGSLRKLMVSIWYPADNSENKPRSIYRKNYVRQVKKSSIFYQLLGLDYVRTNSFDDIKISSKKERFPVVFYLHGLAGTGREGNTSLCEHLASKGFVVFALDFPYASEAVQFPDGRVIKNIISTAGLKYQQRQDLAENEMSVWLEDLNFSLNYLKELNTRTDSFLQQKLDLRAIGFFGHSFGGAASFNFCSKDLRCKAALNMDGKIYGYNPKSKLNSSFLFLLGEESIKTFMTPYESEEDMLKRYSSRKEEKESVQNYLPLMEKLSEEDKHINLTILDKINHSGFSDQLLLKDMSPLMNFIDLGTGSINPQEGHLKLRNLVVEFFNKNLNKK